MRKSFIGACLLGLALTFSSTMVMAEEAKPKVDVQEKLFEYADKLAEATGRFADKVGTEYAPKAAEYAVQAMWADGIARLIVSVICAIGATLAWYFGTKWVRMAYADCEHDREPSVKLVVAVMFTGISGTLLTVGAAAGLLSPDTWIKVISPASALVLKIIG